MAEAQEDDSAARQLWWLCQLREAVGLTGPPPPEVLRSLAPPDEDDEDEDGSREGYEQTPENTRSRSKEPVSPTSPKVVEELASLRWEVQQKQRTVSALEELVDLLQARCRELEEESRELVDLAAAKQEHEMLEAGVPPERRDEDLPDPIAFIKERQLSREPIPKLSFAEDRLGERDAEVERLRLRCEDLEEERLHLVDELEQKAAECAVLRAAVEEGPVAGTLTTRTEETCASSFLGSKDEELQQKCERLEAEKEKLQKHVERLWQMCQTLEAEKGSGSQGAQVRRESDGELQLQAVAHATSEAAVDSVEKLQVEKSQLAERVQVLETRNRVLEDKLLNEVEDPTTSPEAANNVQLRCTALVQDKAQLQKELDELTEAFADLQEKLQEKEEGPASNEKAEVEKELGELATAFSELQVSCRSEKQNRLKAEAALEAMKLELEAERQQDKNTSAEGGQSHQAALDEAVRKVAELEDLLEQQEKDFQEQRLAQDATSDEALRKVVQLEEQLRRQADEPTDEKQVPEAQLSEALRRVAELEETVIKQDHKAADDLQVWTKKMSEEAARTRELEETLAEREAQHAEELQKCMSQKEQAGGSQLKEAQTPAPDGRLAELEQECQTLKGELAASADTQKTLVATHQMQIDGLQSQHAVLEERAAALEKEAATLSDRCAVLSEEKLQLQQQLEEATKEQQGKPDAAEVDELREAVEKLQSEKQSLQDLCAHREAQRDELAQQLEEASASESIYKDEISKSQEKFKSLQADRDGQIKELQEAIGHAEDAQASEKMLSMELHKVGQQLHESEAEVEKVRAELRKALEDGRDAQLAADQQTRELQKVGMQLHDAQEEVERLEKELRSTHSQAHDAQASGDMLTMELQKLGQQLQDSQAEISKLEKECEDLRAQYSALEADHSDLTLRAEDALAQQAALSAEHQRVLGEAQRIQEQPPPSFQAGEQQKRLEAEIVRLQAERDEMARQVKSQAEYHQTRQEDLRADADRLRGENYARADEWKVLVAELADLRSSRTALESKCDTLAVQVKELEGESQKKQRLADTFRQESESLKGDIQKLQKSVLDAASEQQKAAEQAEQLRADAADLEAARRAAQRESSELKRQAEVWAVERGELEADAARLMAANEALLDDNRTLMQRVDDLAPKPESEEAYQAAIREAEHWVLYHAGLPLQGSSLPYLKGVTISFPEFFSHMIPIALASSPKLLRSAAAAVESGELARASLQCFRLCDAHRTGMLAWADEEVSDLVEAVFQRKGLQAPAQEAQHRMFSKFEEDLSGKLCAQDCLCMVDALFRALLLCPAAVSVSFTDAVPEGPRLGPAKGPSAEDSLEARQIRESVAQSRLQRRLEEAERAAEAAVNSARGTAAVGTTGASAGLQVPQSLGVAGLPGLAPSSSGSLQHASPRARSVASPCPPNVRVLDPGRVSQAQF